MSSHEGRESPPPERQTSAQKDPLTSGKGTDEPAIKDDSKSQLDVRIRPLLGVLHLPDTEQNLTSNPPGPLDEAVKEKFKKPTT